MRAFANILLLIAIAISFVVHAGETVPIDFETYQKDFETEPLADHHLFTERLKAYIQLMETIPSKKFSSPKEKALY